MSIKSKQTSQVKAIISLHFLFFRESIYPAFNLSYQAQRELRDVSMKFQNVEKLNWNDDFD